MTEINDLKLYKIAKKLLKDKDNLLLALDKAENILKEYNGYFQIALLTRTLKDSRVKLQQSIRQAENIKKNKGRVF